MLSLSERFLELEKEFSKLKIENAELKTIIVKLTEENAKLTAENAKLKERLGLNSKNSSIPSSKELYKTQKNKPSSGRKKGGQPGHQGHSRTKLTADTIVKVDLASSLCECGAEIALSRKCSVHQKIEIPEIKPHVTEYHRVLSVNLCKLKKFCNTIIL